MLYNERLGGRGGGGGEVADLNQLLPKKETKGRGVLLYLCNYWT